jgi:hypothetical protein
MGFGEGKLALERTMLRHANQPGAAAAIVEAGGSRRVRDERREDTRAKKRKPAMNIPSQPGFGHEHLLCPDAPFAKVQRRSFLRAEQRRRARVVLGDGRVDQAM